MKQKCRKRLVQRRLAGLQSTRKITVLDAMHFIKAAWDSVKEETIQNCFNEAGFCQVPRNEVMEDDFPENEEWRQIAGDDSFEA